MIVKLDNSQTSIVQVRSVEAEELFILGDTTNGDFSVELPDATVREMTIVVKVKGGGAVTLTTDAPQEIELDTELDVTDTVTIKNDLENWWVV